MIRIRFSSAAHRDVLDAQAWYARKGVGLDLSFRDDLDRTLEKIRSYPASFPKIDGMVRRANLRKFPYGVFYTERRDHLFVLGVVHHARHPKHWQSRS